jgi:hypothetical protein
MFTAKAARRASHRDVSEDKVPTADGGAPDVPIGNRLQPG